MKRLMAVSCMFCIFLSCLPQESQAQHAYKGLDATLRKTINFPPAERTTDEHLLEIANGTDINLFVDATGIPDTTETVHNKWGDNHHWSLGTLTRQLTVQKQLIWHVSNPKSSHPNTFLFWQKPDVAAMAKSILAEKVPGASTSPAQQSETEKLLTEYLRNSHQWDAATPGFNKDILLSDLPADLQQALLDQLQQQSYYARRTAQAAEWSVNSFWEKSRIWLVPASSQPGRPPMYQLLVGADREVNRAGIGFVE